MSDSLYVCSNVELLTGGGPHRHGLPVRLEVFVELLGSKGRVEELMDAVGEAVLQDQFLFFFH